MTLPSTRDVRFRAAFPGSEVVDTVASRAVHDHAGPLAWLATALLGLLVFVNEANFRAPTDMEEFSFDWQIGARLLVGAACGLFGLSSWRFLASDLCRPPMLLALLLGIWAALGVPFALNPVHAAGATCSLWCMLFFAPALMRQLGPRQIAATILVSLLTFLAVSWVAQFVAPELGAFEQDSGEEPVFRLGGLTHPNALGRNASFAVAMALVLGIGGYARWRALAVPIAFALVTLAATGSRTSMLTAAACCGLIWVRRVSWTSIVAAACAAALAAALMAATGATVKDLAGGISRTGDAEEIYSFTGRTELWDFVAGRIADSPCFGYGYGGGRFVIVGAHFFATGHAHNELLNVTLNVGLFGGAMLLGMFAVLFVQMLRSPSSFPDLIVLLLFLGGLTESNVFSTTANWNTVALLMALRWRQAFPETLVRRESAGPGS
ncbi:MAG TPA: O-antigen ligase family protein [Pirellulales bacterium]|jgi:O-antigen ligase|nr:O-antigen ligase family protein [Pirellulales bacterium]